MHRTYHLSRVPTFNRKARVLAEWTLAGLFKREIVSLGSLEHPRASSNWRPEEARWPPSAPAPCPARDFPDPTIPPGTGTSPTHGSDERPEDPPGGRPPRTPR
ncbi:hypothetical protein [Streptomyces sp. COG19]|uniref:hypothetical protein n=1 Tax=Streptomyces sp. COG19 TaxID=2838870 RepID=UPI0035B419BF